MTKRRTMTDTAALERGRFLLRSASAVALASGLVLAVPAQAQLAARRGPTLSAPTLSNGSTPGQIRTRAQTDALNRQTATQTRAEQIRNYVKAARDAAARSVPNGLQGLVVADGVTADNLAAGALKAAQDSTGLRTWQGATLPVETLSGSNSLVTIDQTESRAILSWKRFDVGAQTTLQFNQKVGGTAQTDWVAVNRVVDPNAAPSQILGQIKADGTVVVVNRNGVIFANGSQVSANSLLASSLDIGNFAKAVNQSQGYPAAGFAATTVQERNIAFLQNGLLSPNVQSSVTIDGTLTSSLTDGFALTEALDATFTAPLEGDVVVERGASITSGKGGFIILTGPTVSNDGKLTALEGQVSLQAGRAITATPSTGAATSYDPNVRGLILRSTFGSFDNAVVNSGLIESIRGYASLGASLTSTATNSGLISATTSVSRNGTIDLLAGTVTLSGADSQAAAGGLVITPDSNGETIPQGTASAPADFKTSLIRIGAAYVDPTEGATDPLGAFGPGRVTIGGNALIHAPSATVRIGGTAGSTFTTAQFGGNVPGAEALLAASRIDIEDGALIDVSGLKDLTLSMSRNSLAIDPVKRNELRDTPNYREVNTDGQFTLNGATVYVDPRISGVRDDGVAYTGSPLVEAGSAASQIGVTAAELMTKGGSVSLNVSYLTSAISDPALAPSVNIAAGATIDFSGGWVRYLDGIVRTSRLVTADGRIVDIGIADPNDRFIALGDGFTDVQAKFGISRTYSSTILNGSHFEYGYDEGRDAGALLIGASTAVLDGQLYGNAFAGVHQLDKAAVGTRASTIYQDRRALQSSVYQLPSGGYLRVGVTDGTTVLSGDVVVGSADAVPAGTIHLDDAAISAAGLSALNIATTGSVTFTQASDLTLANGGILTVEAGRTARLLGDITAAGGSISVTTRDFATRSSNGPQGNAGSPFTQDDDLFANYADVTDLDPFDIIVTGTLSTAGRWVNDFSAATPYAGSAWTDGGSISLTVAPNVFVGVGGTPLLPTAAADLSGSIDIRTGALLDVSSGGYIGESGTLDLTGSGGSVSLINQTNYASTALTDLSTGNTSSNALPIYGGNQTVTFTPYRVVETTVTPSLVPADRSSDVSFDVSSIRGFGFSGGGTFTLVAPDIAMGDLSTSAGPRVGLDFLAKTGFGTLNLTAHKAHFIDGLFANGNTGTSAFLDTERFIIGNGQTLDLTQTLLPSVLDIATIDRLTELETGQDIFSVLTPAIPVDAWDRRAANLVLGGISELDVLAGGTITGAAGASITMPRLYNAGTIRIAGGSITQIDTLETILPAGRVVGVLDEALGGAGIGALFGGATAGQTSGFDENALTTLNLYRDTAQTRRLTNGQIFSYVAAGQPSFDINAVYTGLVALNEGIHLTGSSVTDLSGTVIYNPRAEFLASGQQLRQGRMIAGGSITTSRFGSDATAAGYASVINPSNLLAAEAGSVIRLDGASGAFDVRLTTRDVTRAAQWSDGGKLILGSGASLAGATITAFGGDDGDADPTRTAASGGVLDWASPTIVQSLADVALNPTYLSADQIMAAGFATLVARGGFTMEGDVTLNLSKSFIATTDYLDGTRSNDAMAIRAGAEAKGLIVAPYIRLASSRRKIQANGESTDAGSITLQSTGTLDVVGAVEFYVGRTLDADGTYTNGVASLIAAGDIRLTGTAGLLNPNTNQYDTGLDGQLVSDADLALKAAQVYATTGTGNLQQLLESRLAGTTEAPSPFVIASSGIDGTVSFEGQPDSLLTTPYSAGTHIAVRGAHIVQNGVLRAPLGMIELGSNTTTTLSPGNAFAPATKTLTLGADSLTSVTARTGSGSDALSIPYGTTTDLIEYYFSPGTNDVLTTMPSGQLTLAAADISIAADDNTEVRFDGRGGGDVFAYEFVSGTGGSRDVLDRLNSDSFSGNGGLQFPDGRQVFALVPKNTATVALYDPIYSADYSGGGGVDIYGLQAGRSVWLDAAPGIVAGEYVLMPAHYALLPGALRIVENVGATALPTDAATTLLDGSITVGGVYGTAGTTLRESERHSFTVQTRDVFLKYSNISTTSGSGYSEDLAEHDGTAIPVLPRDAARVVLAPLNTLIASGQFLTDPDKDGRGSQVDIGGTRTRIGAAGAETDPATANYLLLTTDTLANFNANSLSIGALRTDNADGTTRLSVVTHDLLIDSNVVLEAPELLLTVGGTGSSLTLAGAADGSSGAIVRGTGTLSDTRTGDYVISATTLAGGNIATPDTSGVGSVVRVSTGPERLVSRQGNFADRNTLVASTLTIGAGASLEGAAITLDTSRTFAIDPTAKIGGVNGGAFKLALSADSLAIGTAAFDPAILAQVMKASSLTLRSPDAIDFAAGSYTFNDLTIDAAGIGIADSTNWAGGDLAINAKSLKLRNSGSDLGGCASSVTRACTLGAALTLSAETIELGNGTFRTYGFAGNTAGDGVRLDAGKGVYFTGLGSLSTLDKAGTLTTALTIAAPFIAERNLVDVRSDTYIRPDYTFASAGKITVDGTGLAATPETGSEGPGARIAFSTQQDVRFTHTTVRATAGLIDVSTAGSVYLTDGATLQTSGYARVFDDGVERTTISAGGGTIRLRTSGTGTVIDAAAGTSLIVDNGTGNAGLLDVSASRGAVSLLATINRGLAGGTARAGSINLDTGNSAFDLSGFVANYGSQFGGNVAIRSNAGDLDLAAGEVLKARSVTLTADAGLVTIAGSIDASGDNVSAMKMTDAAYANAVIDGGDIALYGAQGVTLDTTARIVSKTSGYLAADSRQGAGGNVTIGIGEAPGASLAIRSGAVIDVSATRTGDRVIEATIVDPNTQLESKVARLVSADTGGSVLLRAPVLTGNMVAVDQSGTIVGASEKTVEGYRRWNLDNIAGTNSYSGVTLAGNVVTLDAGAVVAGKANLLADNAPGTLIDFVQNFSATGTNGDAFAGYRIRPGVELVSDNSVKLGSNWNLAAGQIVNADGTPGYADALAAGLIAESPLGPYTSGAYAGQPRYEVVAGKEAELFERFVALDYRVGGNVRGEAALVTVRAAGDLDIAHSISDGFFVFHDYTNADYLGYQLGGNRQYNPALALSCGFGGRIGCADSQDYAPGKATNPNLSISVTIGSPVQGTSASPGSIDAPYTALANSVVATGTGDAFGTAELFPLLSDGSAVHSSDLRLVAGSQTGSANMMQIDTAQSGSLYVSGQTSYMVASSPSVYGGQLQLGFPIDSSSSEFYDLDALMAMLADGTSAVSGNADTTISWGNGATGLAAAARTAALKYGQFDGDIRFIGNAANPTGVRGRYSDLVAFLAESGFAQQYVDSVTGTQAAGGGGRLASPVYVGTVVRTGDGSIQMAAAKDIDLRSGVNTRTNPSNATQSAQIGSNAVYTAGVRVAAGYLAGAQVPTFSGYGDGLIINPGRGVALAPVFARDGGDITLTVGRDVIGRRNVWSEVYGGNANRIIGSVTALEPNFSAFGRNSADQPWRYGSSSQTDTTAALAFNYFNSGLGALSGGDVTVSAGRDISDLTIALDNSLVTTHTTGNPMLVTLGSGDLAVNAGRDLLGGSFDIAQGVAVARVGGDVRDAGTTSFSETYVSDSRNLLRVRISDATFNLTAGGSITLGGIGALGVTGSDVAFGVENAGFFSPVAGFSATAIGDITYIGNRPDQYILNTNRIRVSQVLPPSLSLASLAGDLAFAAPNSLGLGAPKVLYASEFGQLSLFAAGNIANAGIAMSDAAPVNFFGTETVLTTTFPTVTSDTDDATLRRLHNRHLTHLNDPTPSRIFAGGSLTDLVISLPEQARIYAGQDIVDLVYYGQNVNGSDVTRIAAGRDITGTTGAATGTTVIGRSGIRGNSIVVGGPGALMVEAGRDLGPFITSASGTARTEAGGIRTIGNEANPWLGGDGADLYALFGIANGMDYAALESVYLDPANLDQLDGDLFVQKKDATGVERPDRTEFTYAPVLAEWMAVHAPEAFAQVFGPTPPTGDALTAASYASYTQLYSAFASLDQLTRNQFLLGKLYFGELSATSDPNSPSFNQFVRGYRVVQTLFPPSRGYTDNLATYEVDPSTVSADHPLGQPTKKLVDGQPAVAEQIRTGNVDLRLSTIGTSRGGDITIIGPGGDFIAGSVVRTSAQINRRVTAWDVNGEIDTVTPTLRDLAAGNFAAGLDNGGRINTIPAGYEGILTLRGGEIRGFTDGSFVLNQSRLFTQAGGDITLWSSNGDLNAGQGPKSASNFPPVVLRFEPNASSEVDSAGSVAGAGIGAFKSSPDDDDATIRLIAPVGTVDAGDAGVRASGNVFVAAARVANADSFSAGGAVSGVPSLATSISAPPPSSAAAAAASIGNTLQSAGQMMQKAARIFVDLLGYVSGGDTCADGTQPDKDGVCKDD